MASHQPSMEVVALLEFLQCAFLVSGMARVQPRQYLHLRHGKCSPCAGSTIGCAAGDAFAEGADVACVAAAVLA